MSSNEKENITSTSKNLYQMGSTNNHGFDSDEQFILDIIRKSKQESIQNLTDSLRMQESKSILLIRLLERYKDQLEEK